MIPGSHHQAQASDSAITELNVISSFEYHNFVAPPQGRHLEQ